MVKIWKNRIEAGDKKLSDCPSEWQSQVIELLREDVSNGVITAERFKEITDIPYEE